MLPHHVETSESLPVLVPSGELGQNLEPKENDSGAPCGWRQALLQDLVLQVTLGRVYKYIQA